MPAANASRRSLSTYIPRDPESEVALPIPAIAFSTAVASGSVPARKKTQLTITTTST